MWLTERDRDLLWWCNSHGSVEVEHIKEKWGCSFSAAARRVRELVQADLLKRVPVSLAGKTVLVVTKHGCSVIDDSLPGLSGVRVATYRHDSLLVELAKWIEMKAGGKFETERRLRHRLENTGHKTSHLPDGLLHRAGKDALAIELELSMKSPVRLKKIISNYAANMSVGRVVYFCVDDAVAKHVLRCAGSASHIQVVPWRPRSTNG
jgi:hypothetical protein